MKQAYKVWRELPGNALVKVTQATFLPSPKGNIMFGGYFNSQKRTNSEERRQWLTDNGLFP